MGERQDTARYEPQFRYSQSASSNALVCHAFNSSFDLHNADRARALGLRPVRPNP